jgi:ubiquinone/menaquinone biosynthesis C-methylase UbiE
MKLYSSIAPYYDQIFPLDPQVLSFIQEQTLGGDRESTLDIACATGSLLLAEQGLFQRLAGLDFNPDLINLARKRLAHLNPDRLKRADMLLLPSLFPQEHFDLITCLGNTLPHLQDLTEIGDFFKSVRGSLAARGIFIFQSINFDRILDLYIEALPTIQFENGTFERRYSKPQNDGSIVFNTRLVVPSPIGSIEDSTRLFPARKEEIAALLRQAGFSRFEFFGDYCGNSWTPDSFLLIGVCQKTT